MRFILKLFEYKKWQLILFLILLGITIGISGYYINSLSEQSLRKEKNNELRSISELKINQILLWKKERLGNAEIISKIPFIKNSIQQLNTKPYIDEQQKVYRDFFKSIVNHIDFDNILVASIDGKLLFSFDSSVTNIDPPTSAYIYRSVKKDSTVFAELYRNSLTKKITLDIITPIHSQVGKIIGVIVFQINPDHYLYPLIQTWPTESKTAETLVIRNDIDSVLFINDIRFHKNAALNLRIPLSKTDVPAVQAALGHKGIWEGKD